jgi:TfoX/Sxy family transcriptional regulator of competence genes
MATQQATADFILEQLSGLSDVSTRKMFGEYALYCDGKVVGLICDDQLFIKITDTGKEFVGENYVEGTPYPGAKPWMLIDDLDDKETLQKLVKLTSGVLPLP